MAFREPPCHLITTADLSPFTKFCLFPLLFHTLSLNFTSSFSLPHTIFFYLSPLMQAIGSLQLTRVVARLPKTLILPFSQTTEHQLDNYRLCFKVARLHTEETITDCVLKRTAGEGAFVPTAVDMFCIHKLQPPPWKLALLGSVGGWWWWWRLEMWLLFHVMLHPNRYGKKVGIVCFCHPQIRGMSSFLNMDLNHG